MHKLHARSPVLVGCPCKQDGLHRFFAQSFSKEAYDNVFYDVAAECNLPGLSSQAHTSVSKTQLQEHLNLIDACFEDVIELSDCCHESEAPTCPLQHSAHRDNYSWSWQDTTHTGSQCILYYNDKLMNTVLYHCLSEYCKVQHTLAVCTQPTFMASKKKEHKYSMAKGVVSICV